MFALLVAAQLTVTPVPCPTVQPGPDWVCQDRQWLPPGHPAIRPTTPRRAPEPNPAPDDATCAAVNPYAEPELAARCADRPLAPDAVPTFLVGRVYAYGYASVRATVLGVTTDIDGIQVVTLRWLPTAGNDSRIEARRTPATPGGATQWWLVPPDLP